MTVEIFKPSWFKNEEALIVNAKTCGINKDGVELYNVNPDTGERLGTVNDELYDSCSMISAGNLSAAQSARYILLSDIKAADVAVPSYYDSSSIERFSHFLEKDDRFTALTLGEMVEKKLIQIKKGHGSPSQDQRTGDVPYIKVSDLRAGLVNINPSNRVPRALAEKKYWKAHSSGLCPFDLLSPERASKNIGEFCVLLPGQEDVLLTKEILVLRSVSDEIDQFYLMWALSLNVVRYQWNRIIFMQTNREDVGERYKEVLIPIPKSRDQMVLCGAPFRSYFEGIAKLKMDLRTGLSALGHDFHVFFA